MKIQNSHIGVLAVQGAFIEHEHMLQSLGVETFEIRQKKDLNQPMDGLILPGGESTVMGKLLWELGMMDTIREKIESGLPVFGTCAGLILLAEKIADEETSHIATMPVKVRRNAYGRQLGSFHGEADMKGIGCIPMTFIRAPYIESCENGVEVLAEVDGRIVAARYKNQLGIAFHQEVTKDTRVHEYFLKMVRKIQQKDLLNQESA